MASAAKVGFEQKLWTAADKMRGSMGPAEYKHVVMGLVFLEYITDTFETLHEKIEKEDLEERIKKNLKGPSF